jgi:hypothetical protein
MNMIELTTIIGNFSQSLYPVQRLISGFAYLLGILFFITAIEKFKKIGDKRAQSSSQEKMYTPMMYMSIGAVLLYLPTALHTVANTAFGVGNVISYTNYNPTNIYSSMGLVIRTVGIVWFVRGCVLVAHASEPGTKDGTKGLLFILAGVFAINFDNSIALINYTLNSLISWTMKLKTSQGF